MKKKEETMTRLHWKSDKERINRILQRIPDKYLIALELQTRGLATNHEDNVRDVKYDGCVFSASAITLKRECVRRGLGEWHSCPSRDFIGGESVPNGRTSYWYVRHYNGEGRKLKELHHEDDINVMYVVNSYTIKNR